MKVPKIFIPKKDLEKKIESLLNYEEPEDSMNILSPIEVESKHYKQIYSMFFEQSLEEIKNAGYERHLYPWEAFSLIVNHLRGDLEGGLKNAASKILKLKGDNNKRGYWLSFAASIEDNKINCYTNPKNLLWYPEKSKYAPSDEKSVACDESLQFDITTLGPKRVVSLDDFEEELTKHLCRDSKSLLRTLLSKNYKVVISLPDSYGVWPGVFHAWVDQKEYVHFQISFYNTNAYAQGVKDKR